MKKLLMDVVLNSRLFVFNWAGHTYVAFVKLWRQKPARRKGAQGRAQGPGAQNSKIRPLSCRVQGQGSASLGVRVKG